MEIKKIIILLIVVFIPLSLFLFSDMSQYKQIGDTHFYLLPNEMGQESFLYHDGEAKGVFFPIHHTKEQSMMSIGINNTLLSNVANRKKKTGT